MYKLMKLPYDYDALEPFIDTHTIGLHYHKHMANYLKKLNDLLIKNNNQFNGNLTDVLKSINKFKSDRDNILYNLGGVINHEIYFSSISNNRVLPNNNLMNLINNTFGSYENFQKEFKEKALSIKGSGYTFLVLNYDILKIVNLLNQDNPYNYGYYPLIGIDMWEHAYYINYENKKDLYIDNFLEIIDFKKANELF